MKQEFASVNATTYLRKVYWKIIEILTKNKGQFQEELTAINIDQDLQVHDFSSAAYSNGTFHQVLTEHLLCVPLVSNKALDSCWANFEAAPSEGEDLSEGQDQKDCQSSVSEGDAPSEVEDLSEGEDRHRLVSEGDNRHSSVSEGDNRHSSVLEGEANSALPTPCNFQSPSATTGLDNGKCRIFGGTGHNEADCFELPKKNKSLKNKSLHPNDWTTKLQKEMGSVSACPLCSPDTTQIDDQDDGQSHA